MNILTQIAMTTLAVAMIHGNGVQAHLAVNPMGNAQPIFIVAKTKASSYKKEMLLIRRKGYSVTQSKPNAMVKTRSGDVLTAWLATATKSQDGHNQWVFFFLNNEYLGTDTAKPSLEITKVKSDGNGIAVTYQNTP